MDSEKTLPNELKIKPHSTILVIGKRGVGKSVMTKWLLMKMLEQGIYNKVYLFSTTEKYSHSFDCIPKEDVIEGYDMKFVDKIIKAHPSVFRFYKLYNTLM